MHAFVIAPLLLSSPKSLFDPLWLFATTLLVGSTHCESPVQAADVANDWCGGQASPPLLSFSGASEQSTLAAETC